MHQSIHDRGEATAEEPVLATPFWGMLYGDDADVVPQSSEQLRKMMGVIVVLCAVFGLTVSEDKTEIIILRKKGMPETIAIFSVDVAGQVERIRIPRGGRQSQRRPVHRG